MGKQHPCLSEAMLATALYAIVKRSIIVRGGGMNFCGDDDKKRQA